jgi:hypothetical protein
VFLAFAGPARWRNENHLLALEAHPAHLIAAIRLGSEAASTRETSRVPRPSISVPAQTRPVRPRSVIAAGCARRRVASFCCCGVRAGGRPICCPWALGAAPGFGGAGCRLNRAPRPPSRRARQITTGLRPRPGKFVLYLNRPRRPSTIRDPAPRRHDPVARENPGGGAGRA